MTLHEDTDLDALSDQIRAEVDRLKAVQAAAAGVAVTGRSSDGAVTVQMDGLGAVTRVAFHPTALERHDHQSLSAAVTEAMADAAGRALAKVLPSYPEITPSAEGATTPSVDHEAPAVSAWTREASSTHG